MKKNLTKHASHLLVLGLLSIGSSLGLSLVAPTASHAQIYVTYTPPYWAPPYDNVSTVRYYYIPDCDMYYDVWDRQYYYNNGGDWIATLDVPGTCGIDLSSAYIVLINRGVDRPWLNHDFYIRNYPPHHYDQYRDIVVRNRIITNLHPGHELVPRAYNENNRRVTFMQRPTQAPGAPPRPAGSPAYHQQAHEVPMRSIAPSMPAASRKLNYGGATNRAPRNAPPVPSPAKSAPAAPRAPAQSRPAPAPSHGNGGGKGR
jgi:hypothetical protein